MIVEKKIVKKLGGSLVVILGSKLTKKLNIDEGDPIRISVTKLNPRQYFCYVDEYEFTSDDDIEQVVCPICSKGETVKLLTHSNRGERRSTGSKMVKKDIEEVDEVEEDETPEDEEEEPEPEEEW